MKNYRVMPVLALCLLLNGCGRLSVSSPYGHGIVSKDELTLLTVSKSSARFSAGGAFYKTLLS